MRTVRRPVLAMIGLIVGGYLVTSIGVGMSLWRGSIRDGQPVGLLTAVRQGLENPVIGLTSAGVDTLDGAAFSDILTSQDVRTAPLNFLNALTLFVPRQLYPEKGQLLSNDLSARYLGYKTSGMYLSGPGYFKIILGSWWLAVVACCLLGLIYALAVISRLMRKPVYWAVATYCLALTILAGDVFPAFRSLEIILLLFVTSLGVSYWRSHHQKDQVTARQRTPA